MSKTRMHLPVDLVGNISPADFEATYRTKARPVVMRNSLKWPAFTLWTHQWFQSRFGSTLVDLSVNPTHTAKVVQMRLGDYIDKILRGQGLGGGLYLDQFPLERLPLLKQHYETPCYCSSEREVKPHLWLGPGTTVLSFHKDNHNPLITVENIFVQVRGKKRILLASPDNDAFMYPRSSDDGAQWHSRVDPDLADLSSFPLYANAQIQEAIVEPGDAIYIPRNYWHHVRALEPSISMSFWWIPFRLSEVSEKVLSMSNAEFASTETRFAYALTSHDIEEFGGMDSFRHVLEEMKGDAIIPLLYERLGCLIEPGILEAFKEAYAGLL